MKLDQRGSVVLGEGECRRHLASLSASSGIGRIAFNGSQSPYVIPVNFTLADGGILIRLGSGRSAFHLDGAAVTFETDEADSERRSGWSVIVEGIARLLPYDETARLGANLPLPIVAEPGVCVYEIIPFKVSGRAVEPRLRFQRVESGTGPLESGDSEARVLRLGKEAADQLATVLQSALANLNSEITDTDDPAFRRMIRVRRLLLEGIAAQLTADPVEMADAENPRDAPKGS